MNKIIIYEEELNEETVKDLKGEFLLRAVIRKRHSLAPKDRVIIYDYEYLPKTNSIRVEYEV